MNRQVVLIAEDEALVQIVLQQSLEDAGFGVLTAGNAADAMELLENHPEVDILFTDIDMPGTMNGVALAHFVKNRWPPVKLVITSGRPIPNPSELPPKSLFFSKPYDMNRIVETFRAMV